MKSAVLFQLWQLRVNYSNNSFLGAELQRGEKAPQQVKLAFASVPRYCCCHRTNDHTNEILSLAVAMKFLDGAACC